MARDTQAKCRKCRRAGEKLFLKGDRCGTPKCAMTRRAYAPGVHGKKPGRGLSEYGLQLAAKQKLKRVYGILEKQFRKHFDDIKHKKGITGDLLLARLEMRLDNVIYRTGLAASRSQARQLVNHGLIVVDGKKVTIPSYEIKIGQTAGINPNKAGKNYFKNLEQILKNKNDFPSWLTYDVASGQAKITAVPNKDEIGVNVDAQIIVEYYSR
ncbi:MAG: 30S ribosomal protein S4 [Parcubacteria group bacterium]